MKNTITKAKKIVTDNLYMVLATSLDDEPWAAPLFFAVDEEYNFYFISGKATRHATHIKKNPNVAITIYDSHDTPEEADGVYIEGVAKQMRVRGLRKAMDLVYLKRFPDEKEREEHYHPISDFLEDMSRRFFKVTPKKFYKLDENNTTSVDRRVEIDLSDLAHH